MPRFYLMIGIPGSGKTSVARSQFSQALRASFDDVRLMLTGKFYVAEIELIVKRVGDSALEALLSKAPPKGYDVLLDATNVSRARRARYIRMAARHGLETVAVFGQCDLQTALKRNQQRPGVVPENVVRRMFSNLQPPTADEGFAEILVVDTSSSQS